MQIKQSSYKFAVIVAGALALLSVNGTAIAAEQDGDFIRVFMNHARVLKLDRAVAKVIIGNNQVADATVADSKTIVLTGRSFGTTNLVLLDAADNAIVDQRVLVSIDEGNTVRVFRQTDRTVYSCTPNCEQHVDLSSAGTSASTSSASSSMSSSSTAAQ